MDDPFVAIDKNEGQAAAPNLIQRFNQLSNPRKLLVIAIAAAIIAAAMAVFFWMRDPGYKVLFSGLADKDSGQIIQRLEQLNIPYKLEAGMISVPAEQVHELRLKLAVDGLPKSGNVGFELLDNQKFGISQFGEQVNYQRAIEGELANTIQRLKGVEAARVHIAMPKQTVFLREQQKPTASVLLTLHSGIVLDTSQITGIIRLVSSSIPDLPAGNVSVVDQEGNLLSTLPEYAGSSELNKRQLAYKRQVEAELVAKVKEVVEPVVGANNVNATVTAEVDFSEVEQTSESFKPNSPPNAAAIRSEKTAEGSGVTAGQPSGVPGALSNQPPGAAAAPVSLPNPPGATDSNGQSQSSHKEATRNYEVDKTIQHVKQPTGSIKRLTAAVVVNYKRVNQKDGGIKSVPLTKDEMNKISDLVREAMGYSKTRGDSLNVVNAAFADRLLEVEGKSFLERTSEYIVANTLNILKLLLIVLLLVYMMLFVVRPLLRDVIRPKRDQAALPGEEGSVALTAEELAQSEVEAEAVAEAEATAQMAAFSELMQRAKDMAREDPRMVATIIREWLNSDPGDKKAS